MTSNSKSSRANGLFLEAWHAAWIENDPKTAITKLAAALEIEDSHPEANLEMAKIILGQMPEKLDLAKQWISRYLTLRPESADGHYILATIRRNANEFEGLIEIYEKAIALDPFDLRPVMGLAYHLRDQGRIFEALLHFEKIVEWMSIKHMYGEPATRYALADIYQKTDKIEEAKAQWEIVSNLPDIWEEDHGYAEASRERLRQYIRGSE